MRYYHYTAVSGVWECIYIFENDAVTSQRTYSDVDGWITSRGISEAHMIRDGRNKLISRCKARKILKSWKNRSTELPT